MEELGAIEVKKVPRPEEKTSTTPHKADAFRAAKMYFSSRKKNPCPPGKRDAAAQPLGGTGTEELKGP